MGFLDLFSFWKRDKKTKDALEAINSVELQNEVLNRTGFGRLYEEGGIIDRLPKAYGEFGRVVTNPIPVNGSYGEVTYLSRLRVMQTGDIIVFHRLGSFGSEGVCNNPVDGYAIRSLDGTFEDLLFFDMYHDGQSLKVPDGYTMVDKLEGLTGVPYRMENFPHGIYEAVARYATQVFGAPVVLDELKQLDVGLTKSNTRQKHLIDRKTESEEYLHGCNVAGMHLQKLFIQHNKTSEVKYTEFCWLRTDIVSPSFDSMNFRYKNMVFSVLVDLNEFKNISNMKTQDNEHGYGVSVRKMMVSRTGKRKRELQIEVCKANDMIPCLFSVAVDGMKPLHKGWNLINTETGKPVIPTDIADDSPRLVSAWEKMNWGIAIVMDDLRKQGNEILSYTDAPGIAPQLWFENSDSEKCWVQVIVNDSAEAEDLSGTGAEKYKGYLANVSIRPPDNGALYRSRPASISYEGLTAI